MKIISHRGNLYGPEPEKENLPSRISEAIRNFGFDVEIDIATCGIYWFKRGKDFVKAANEMIQKDIRTNNEFYIAPVFNELVEKKDSPILPFYVEKMWGIGTPEDLQYYLSHVK